MANGQDFGVLGYAFNHSAYGFFLASHFVYRLQRSVNERYYRLHLKQVPQESLGWCEPPSPLQIVEGFHRKAYACFFLFFFYGFDNSLPVLCLLAHFKDLFNQYFKVCGCCPGLYNAYLIRCNHLGRHGCAAKCAAQLGGYCDCYYLVSVFNKFPENFRKGSWGWLGSRWKRL